MLDAWNQRHISHVDIKGQINLGWPFLVMCILMSQQRKPLWRQAGDQSWHWDERHWTPTRREQVTLALGVPVSDLSIFLWPNSFPLVLRCFCACMLCFGKSLFFFFLNCLEWVSIFINKYAQTRKYPVREIQMGISASFTYLVQCLGTLENHGALLPSRMRLHKRGYARSKGGIFTCSNIFILPSKPSMLLLCLLLWWLFFLLGNY